tara:strand:- start:154 stop:393 length:240 start_codon:yes stop_codon:yes gene_type:complete
MSSDKKPLSKKKRGYLLATLGGSFGGPFGWITSPLVLYVLNKKVKSKDGSQPNIFKLWGLFRTNWSTHKFMPCSIATYS